MSTPPLPITMGQGGSFKRKAQKISSSSTKAQLQSTSNPNPTFRDTIYWRSMPILSTRSKEFQGLARKKWGPKQPRITHVTLAESSPLRIFKREISPINSWLMLLIRFFPHLRKKTRCNRAMQSLIILPKTGFSLKLTPFPSSLTLTSTEKRQRIYPLFKCHKCPLPSLCTKTCHFLRP